MWETLGNYLITIVDLFRVLTVVEPWERALVIRMGTLRRELTPGWYWVCPFAIDTVLKESVVIDTVHLRAQSLTTADDEMVTVAAVLTYEIVDIKKTLLEIQGVQETLSDTAYGVVKTHVAAAQRADLASDDFESKLTSAIRRRAKEYGISIKRVQLSDCARMMSLRLIQG